MSKKKNIVLIPGLLCDSYLWHHQVEKLSDDYTIFIADVTQSSHIEDLARDVLLNAPEVFAMVGLSMGGYVALEIMRQAPERVEKLVITNSSARLDTEQTRRRRQGLIAMVRGAKKFKGVTPKLLPLLIHESRLKHSQFTQPIMDMAERVGKEAFLNQQEAILSRSDSVPSLSKINIPTLIVGGDEDQITPADHSIEMGKYIPHSTLEIFDDCGHLAPLEYPEKFNSVLKGFLESE